VAEALRSLFEKKYDVIGFVWDGRELLTEAPKLMQSFNLKNNAELVLFRSQALPDFLVMSH
jgi:hypothetical protein